MPYPPKPSETEVSDPGPSVHERVRWPNVLAGDASSGGSRSSLAGGDYSALEDGDPELVALLDECAQRIEAGEIIDIERLAAEHPTWAVKLRWLIPPIQKLAGLHQDLEEEATPPAWDDSEGAPQRAFRNFRILREVGRGGMGIVYEAQQATLGRHVAVKVLPVACALDPRALQRFQLEAQVAGWLQHPRIVPVYAVGLVGDVPYFVMPFIDGGSLAELIGALRRREHRADAPAAGTEPVAGEHAAPGADSHAGRFGTLADQLLSGHFAPPRRDPDSGRAQGAHSAAGGRGETPASSIQSRAYIRTVVRLGIQAAEALDYAHGQGVVHRDIKPANLLLDRQGDIWVADFGMADVQGSAELTMTGDLPGTLRYMSPEQAAGKRALIDRRTDIYSLGAMLYEMLTLQPAIIGSEHAEVIRRIAEDDPEPVRRLNRAVPADLATIVTKALSKEPPRRYETARQLADDLERFLDGRPIAARPVGALARTSRWCRRKPVQAALAAGLLMSLVGGLAGITWNWREAVRQRHDALQQKELLQVAERQTALERDQKEAQRAKADAINRFLIDKLLLQAAPEHNTNARTLTLRAALDHAAEEVATSFQGQPQIEAAIRLALGQTYHELGEFTRSESHFRRALELLALDKGDPGPDQIRATIELGHILTHLDRNAEAERLLRQASDQSRRILGALHEATLMATRYLASLYRQTGRRRESEAMLRQSLDEARHGGRGDSPEAASAMSELASLLAEDGRPAEAEGLYRACLKLQLESLGNRHPDTMTTQSNLAYVLGKLGRLEEAEALARQSLEIRRQVIGPEHPSTLLNIQVIAGIVAARGRRDEAETLLRACLETQRRTLGPDHSMTRLTEKELGELTAGTAGKK